MAEDSKTCTTCGRRFGDEALFCPKDGSVLVPIAAAAAPKAKDTFVGREILGHIQIKSLIGNGAMGRVYRAYQKGIERDVAVKILHKELAQNPDLVARFLREAKVASKLDHPNVVKVLLAGQLDDGTMYLVMEFVDGVSLQAALLAAGGALPLPRALHIALQLCDAVGEAHAAGVIHRDVKPENVMLVKRGDDIDFVKVLDFGIARLGQKDGGSAIETQAGLVFGTARYLSPEGARGEAVQASSDVYAIATVLYQMLAGRTPFEHESSVSLLVAQIHDPPPPLHTMPSAAHVPFDLEAVIMRNLSKDASLREPDGHGFGHALLEAAALSGLHVDDLLPRPAVARGRRSSYSPHSLPSAEKTREENFGIHGRSPVAVHAVPAGDPRLNTPRPGPQGAGVYNPSYSGRPADAVQETPAPRRVAKTLDDEPNDPAAQTPAPPEVHGPNQQHPAPPAAFAHTIGMPPPAASPVRDPPGARRDGDAHRARGELHGEPRAHAEGAHAAIGQESILGTAATPPDERLEAHGVPRRNRFAALWLVLGLAVLATVGIGGYRLGYFGPKPVVTKRAEIDQLLAKAQAALDAQHWDRPPGDNVLELTDKLIELAPGENRTYQLRSTASDRIVRHALERKAENELAESLQLLRLANKLTPGDHGLQAMIEDVEALAAQDPKLASLVTDGGAGRFKVSLKPMLADNDKDAPHPGEQAALEAVITGDPAPHGIDPNAHFIVSGPGLVKPVLVDTHVEKTTKYVANFVFPQLGTYKAHFAGKPDGFPVHEEMDVKVVPRGAFVPPAPTSKPSTSATGYWPIPTPSTKPSGKPTTTTSPTGTVTLTPDPVPFPLPGTTGAPPPPPLPTLGK